MIKKIFFLCVMLTAIQSVVAQCKKSNRTKHSTYQTQRQEEKDWAEKLFNGDYQRQEIQRFGKVKIINDTLYDFQNKVILIRSSPIGFRNIFRLGIIYPQLFNANEKQQNDIPEISQKDTLGSRDLFNFLSTDTLYISNIEELHISNSLKKRRFRLLLWRNGIANPFLYFFELTNEMANRKSDLSAFINGSRLTYFRMHSILL